MKYFLNSIINTIDDPVFVKNNKHEWVVVNDAFCKLIGHNRDELIGKSDFDFFPKDEAEVFWEKDNKVFTSGITDENEESFTDKNGEKHIISTKKSIFLDENGDKILVGVIRDITALKNTEANLKKAKEVAEKANKAKTDFLANMSHEIRTPLNSIIAFTQLLQDDEQNLENLEMLGAIETSGEILKGLIDDILNIAKIEAGKVELAQKEFNIRSVLYEAVERFKPIAKNKNLTLELNIHNSIPEILVGDKLRISQILNNLVSNSVKFTETGFVRVKASLMTYEKDQATIKIIVEDSGIGISDDYIPHLFEQFSQADISNTKEYEGTGLGLSIVKKILDLMGGGITMESEVGSGTSFEIAIPFQIGNTESFIDDELSDDQSINCNILIAEDNKLNQFLIEKLLKKKGYKYTLVDNGLDVLESVQKEKFDLIIMDIQMPKLNGLDASKRLKQSAEYSSIPIIAVTANALKEDIKEFDQLGLHYMSKPIDVKEFYKLIDSCLIKSIK